MAQIFEQFFSSFANMSTVQIIGQVISLIATVISIASFQCKNNKILFGIQCITCTLFCTSFILIGGMVGVAINVVCLLRNVALFINKKWSKNIVTECVLIVAAVIVSFIFSEGTIIDIFPLLATIISTMFMYTNDGSILRYAQLIGVSPCWLTYDIYYMNIGGSLTEIFVIISVIVSFIRYKNNFTREETK